MEGTPFAATNGAILWTDRLLYESTDAPFREED